LQILDDMYTMLDEHFAAVQAAADADAADAANGSTAASPGGPGPTGGGRLRPIPASEVGAIRSLHKAYKDANTRLFTAVSRSRSLLLGQLPLISSDTKVHYLAPI
jgi:hypothetical protein